MNLLSVALLGTGGILMYSAVKGYDPREVVRAALRGKPMSTVPQAYVTTPSTIPPMTGGGSSGGPGSVVTGSFIPPEV